MPRLVITRRSRASTSGSALVAVVFTLLVAAAITGSLLTAMRTDIGLSMTLEREMENELLAESGIALAILNLSDPKSAEPLTPDGRTYELRLDGRHVLVEVQSELGKINLNQSANLLLKRLLAACSTEGVADRLGKAIEDRIAAKDGRVKAFLTVDELRRLEGASAELVAAIEPYVSVYNFRAEPDFALAPAKLKELMAEGHARTPSNEVAGSTPASTNRIGIFSITASILGQTRGPSIRAVVYVTGDKSDPYHVFDWRRVRRESIQCEGAQAAR